MVSRWCAASCCMLLWVFLPCSVSMKSAAGVGDLLRQKRQIGEDSRTVIVYEKLNVTLISDNRERRHLVISPVVEPIPDQGLAFDPSDEKTSQSQVTIHLTNCSAFFLTNASAYESRHVLLIVMQTDRDGMLYAYQSDVDSSKSFIYIRTGRLFVAAVGPDGSKREVFSLAIRGTSFENGFASNVVVQLTFVVTNGRQLELYVGDALAMKVQFRRVRLMLINSFGRIAIGVALNTAALTDNEVESDFVGFLYNILLFYEEPPHASTADQPLSSRSTTTAATFTTSPAPASAQFLLNTQSIMQRYAVGVLEIWPYIQNDPAHVTSNIDKGGVKWISLVPAVIGTLHVHQVDNSSSRDFQKKNPVTFYGAKAAFRIVTREKSRFRFDIDMPVRANTSLEFGVLTFDDVGVVLFQGGDRRAFYSFELFDGYLYFVYNWESDFTNRTRVCSQPIPEAIRRNLQNRKFAGSATDGTSRSTRLGEVHVSFRISRPTNPRLVIQLDCDLDNDGVWDDSQQLVAVSVGQSFGSFLYVGGVDGLGRLPWPVWSRTYFNGAVTYLRLNGLFPAYEDFFGQHTRAGVKLGLVEVSDYCSASDCASNETGRCLIGRPFVTGNQFYCDCAHLNRVAKTCARLPVVFNFTVSFFELSLRSQVRSHTDDLSITFKTSQTCDGRCAAGSSGLRGGTMLRLFNENMISNLVGFKLLEVRLMNGELQLAIIVNGSVATKQPATIVLINLFNHTNTRLNDNAWHTLRYKRRANDLLVYVDQRLVYQGFVAGSGFFMETTRVGVACSTTGDKACEPDSQFDGQLRNLIFNDIDYLSLIRAQQLAKATSSQQGSVVTIGDEDVGVVIDDVKPAEETASVGPLLLGFDSFTLIGQPDSLIELAVSELPAARPSLEFGNTAFTFRTKLRNCVLSYQRPRSWSPSAGEFLALELVDGRLRVAGRIPLPPSPYLRTFSVQYAAFELSFANTTTLLDDGFDHQVRLVVSQHEAKATLDNSIVRSFAFETAFDSLPDSLFYNSMVYFGGVPNASDWQNARRLGHLVTPSMVYFAGCFRAIRVNDDRVDSVAVVAYNTLAGIDRVYRLGCTDSFTLQCSDLNCANGAACVQPAAGNAQCVCTGSGYVGNRCNQYPYGYYVAPNGQVGGYVIDPFSPGPANRDGDSIRLGVMTKYPNGTLLRIESLDRRRSLTISLVNCDLVISFTSRRANTSNIAAVSREASGPLCDAMYNVVTLNRNGNSLMVTVRRGLDEKTFGPFELSTLSAFFAPGSFKVIVGADALPNSAFPFTGIIGGFSWNGVENKLGNMVGDVTTARDPYILLPIPCPNVFNVPCGAVTGGSPSNGPGTEREEPVSSTAAVSSAASGGFLRGFGGAFLENSDAVLPVISADSSDANSAPMVTAFAIIAGLLMAFSGFVWAFYRCKPGAPAWCLCMNYDETGQYGVVPTGPSVTIKNTGENDIPTVQKGELRSAPPNLTPDAPQVHQSGVVAQTDETKQPEVQAITYSEDIPTETKGPLRSAGPAALVLNVTELAYNGYQPAASLTSISQSQYYRSGAVLDSNVDLVEREFGQNRDQYQYQSTASFLQVGEQVGARNGARLMSMQMQQDATGALSIPDDAKVSCFALGHIADFVVTGSSTAAPSIWDLRTGNLVRTVDGGDLLRCAHGLHLACTDRILAGEISRSFDDTQSGLRSLQLWEVANGRRVDLPYEILCQATCVLHNDVEIACAAIDRSKLEISVLVWNILTNQVTKSASCSLHSFLLGDANCSVSLFVSPDDKYLLVAIDRAVNSSAGGEIFFLSFSEATLCHRSSDEPAFAAVECNPKSVTMLPGVVVIGDKVGDLLLHDMHTLRLIKQINTAQLSAISDRSTVCVGSSSAVTSLSTSPNSRLIASGHGTGLRNFSSLLPMSDRTATEFSAVRLWHVTSISSAASVQSLDNDVQISLMHILLGHSDDVADCSFSSDNEYLVSGSKDGSIRMWRVRDGSQVCWFVSNVEVHSVRMTESMNAIVALGEYQRHRKLVMLQLVRQKTKRTQPLAITSTNNYS